MKGYGSFCSDEFALLGGFNVWGLGLIDADFGFKVLGNVACSL